jgi:hypothetical protein
MTQTIAVNTRTDQAATDPFFSEANMNRLRKAIADVESGKAKLTEHELIEEIREAGEEYAE